MNKPRVFISSTIYDFKDLRSSLEYWLSEVGYDVQLSEQPNFNKNSSKHSYDVCLEAISKCDFFILLIGSRKGGMYDDNVSITRKEYQTAYDLAKAGKINRIITFIRQNVWDVLEDRKSLVSLLNDLENLDNSLREDKLKSGYYDSKILCDAEHIKKFVDEVRKKPLYNWINVFNGYSDIVNVLESELCIKANISTRIMEQNIKLAVVNNLRWIYNTENGKIVNYFQCFRPIRDKLLSGFNPIELANSIISLTSRELRNSADFFVFFRHGIDRLSSSVFDDAISSGAFLYYDGKTDVFVDSKFSNALLAISDEIKRVKEFAADIPSTERSRIYALLRESYRSEAENYSFGATILSLYSAVYERLHNICVLSKYIINYIDFHDDSMEYPDLLHGRVGDTRPSKDDILMLIHKEPPT
jgi:hypothetical protein